MERQPLAGLRPQNYEHPLDTKALDALQQSRGLDTLVRKLNEWGFERLLRVQLTGSYLRVGPDSFPQIHEMVVEGCRVLDLPKRPEVYIAAGGVRSESRWGTSCSISKAASRSPSSIRTCR